METGRFVDSLLSIAYACHGLARYKNTFARTTTTSRWWRRENLYEVKTVTIFFFSRYDYYYRRERRCSSRERATNVYIFTRASESFIARTRAAFGINDRARRDSGEGPWAPRRESARVNIISLVRCLGRSRRVLSFRSGNRPLSFAATWNTSGSISAETTRRRDDELWSFSGKWNMHKLWCTRPGLAFRRLVNWPRGRYLIALVTSQRLRVHAETPDSLLLVNEKLWMRRKDGFIYPTVHRVTYDPREYEN